MTIASAKADVELASRLREAVGPLQRRIRQQTVEPYTPTELSVLGAIGRHSPITISDLAERELLSAPTISTVVASLESNGMVKRITDTNDRRVCYVALSPEGSEWLEVFREHIDSWLVSQLARLDPDQRAILSAATPVLELLVKPE